MNLNDRHVKYDELIPCKNAFIDTRTPGSDRKENFTIIGPGVSENPDQHIHVSIPHGFNIGGARQPNGCLNSQHSHLTEEVFIVHSGTWAFRSGVDGKDGEIILKTGDIISLPTDIFRGFENVGNGNDFLFAVLGGDDPGRVTWAPSVFELANKYGLVLLENGALIDTNLGQTVPKGVRPMPTTNQQQIDQHRIVSSTQMQDIIIRTEDFDWSEESALSAYQGVSEAPLVGGACPNEGITAAKLNWPHNFVIRALQLAPGAQIPSHQRMEEEVIFVQSGTLNIEVDGETFVLNTGDTFTTPINAPRQFHNQTDLPTTLYVTRRTNAPKAPLFL